MEPQRPGRGDGDPAELASSILDLEAERLAAGDDDGTPMTDGQLVGVGDDEQSLADVLHVGGRAPIALLALVTIVDAFDGAAFAVLSPEIRSALDISDLVLGMLGALGGLVAFAGAIPIGWLADRSRRWTIVGIATALGALAAASTAFVQNSFQMLLARIGAGLPQAHRTPVHNALIVDTYPPAGRARIFAIHQGANPVSRIIGPAMAGTLAAYFGTEGWRQTFFVISIPAVALGIVALFMREPPRGRFEQEAALGHTLDAEPEELHIGVGAALARLKKVKTFYYTMAALGALGFALITAGIYMNLILEARFGLSPAARGGITSIAATGSLVGAYIGGVYGDRLFRRSPALALRLSGIGVAILGISIPLEAYAPSVPFYIVVAWLTGVATGGAFVPASPVIAAVTPYKIRSMGYALIGLYMSLFGGVGGALVVGIMADSLGRQKAIAIVSPLAAITGGILLAYGGKFARGDMEAAAAEILAEQTELARIRSGEPVPVLQVRRLDFSYGPVQVLFDVNLDVAEGEVLALLGTNGAGKSTLLRAISGLGFPDRGEIRIDGETITYLDSDDRVRRGVVQVAGGKGVFASLTVAENLSVGAHTYIWDRDRVERRAHEVLELFPVLAERSEQRAGSLSGGERQMLAIAKGLMLEPRLLLIDELTIGLAPVVVQQLLPTIEALKAQGMTIVIVEQSVNVALSLAERAVFMEKGRVRFEGPARELAARDDLVRAVFLGTQGG